MAEFKDKAVTGLFIGLGAAVLAPAVLPILVSVGRPLAKAGLKGGMMLLDKIKEKAAETGELLEDMAAEARAELAEEKEVAMGKMAAAFSEPPEGAES